MSEDGQNKSWNGGQKRAKKRRMKGEPWEPNDNQLEWYRKWVYEHKSALQIAREHPTSITRQTVWVALQRVSEWARGRTWDEIIMYRHKQTTQLEDICSKLMNAWNDSVGQIVTVTETVGDEGDKTVTKTEVSQGNPAYISQLITAMREIRKIWGVDAPAKSEVSYKHAEEIEGLPMGQGFASRADAMKAAAEALLRQAEKVAKGKQPALEP